MMTTYKRILFICALFIFITVKINAEETSPMVKLDNIADDVLQLTKLQRYDDAKNSLAIFEKEFNHITSDTSPFTMDELRVLTSVHHQATEAVTSVNMDHEERVNKATTFRLVMDSFISQHQPLWSEMENPVMSAFSQLKTAASHGDHDTYHYFLQHFLEKYEIIEPVLKLNMEVETFQSLDAKIIFIEKYTNSLHGDNALAEQLNNLEEDLHQIFDAESEDSSDPSLLFVIGITGSIIILTLSYVSWRKYKGQKRKQREKHKD